MKNHSIKRLIDGLLCLVAALILIFACAALAEGQEPPESPVSTPAESPPATPTPVLSPTPKPVTSVRVARVEARPSVRWGAVALLSLACIVALVALAAIAQMRKRK